MGRWSIAVFVSGLVFVVVAYRLTALTEQGERSDFSDLRAHYPAPDVALLGGIGLSVSFMGTSTILVSLDDRGDAILTDAFFSRNVGNRRGSLQLAELFLNPLASVIQPNHTAIELALGRLNLTNEQLKAVIPVHSHHDHALDSGYVCSKFSNCKVYGTASTKLVVSNDINESRIVTVSDAQLREIHQIGDFQVTFIKSMHGKFPWPISSFLIGQITKRVNFPAHLLDFKDGGCISVHISSPKLLPSLKGVIIHGSAGFVPGAFEGIEADLVFLGTTLLSGRGQGFIDEYFKQVVLGTGAKYVVPVHWDDFTIPIDGTAQTRATPSFDREIAYLQRWCTSNAVQFIWMDIWQKLRL